VTRLIVFAGLPGSGKSSIARGLAKQLGAVWLRIDSIEQAIRESAIAPPSVTSAQVVEVEILCTDLDEHRRRIETRASETPGLILPDWNAVIGRDYHSWDRDHLAIDTAGRSIAACVELVLAAL
jgi:chloramphenicol 3-O-phosphotransferase